MHKRSTSLDGRLLLAALSLSLLVLPLARASAASGGSVKGSVTDPRGAVVVGATVAVLDAASGRKLKEVKTDAQGRYRIEGLPAGSYVVVVTAAGFKETRREQVSVANDKAESLDVKLEVALDAGAAVNVSTEGLKPNGDPVYASLRKGGDTRDFTVATAYSVNNLELKRDAATFTMTGEVYFLPPIEGRTVAAVFVGGGEMNLTPPTDAERKSISIFTGEPKLTEAFSTLVMRFTDKTFDEIKASPRATPLPNAPQAARARGVYEDVLSVVRKQKNPFGMDLRYNYDMRTLVDIYSPERPGFFTAFVGGARFKKLVYRVDPMGVDFLAPEEVALMSYGQTDWGYWAAFHREEEYAARTASSDEDHRIYDALRHEIDAAIKGTQLAATDRLTLRILAPGARVLPFDLYRSLRVSRVQDETGKDLEFIQEAKDEDADFAVILPQALKRGDQVKLDGPVPGRRRPARQRRRQLHTAAALDLVPEQPADDLRRPRALRHDLPLPEGERHGRNGGARRARGEGRRRDGLEVDERRDGPDGRGLQLRRLQEEDAQGRADRLRDRVLRQPRSAG